MTPSPLLPALALLVNAFVWGVSWWPFRELQDRGLHPLWSTTLVYLLSLAALLAWRPGALRAFAAHPLLWLLLALAGVVIILKTPQVPWPVPESLADWLALMGGFSFALTNIMLRKLNHVPSEARILAMFGGGAAMACAAGLAGAMLAIVPAPASPQAGWVGVAVALSLGFLAGNIALQYGAARLAAQTTALVMLSEVIFASVSAVMLGAAELSPRTWLGGALILAAAVWSAWPASTDDGPRPVAQ